MLLFNLKLIFRNLYKNRLYTFVNVAGLSVALAVCLYTGLWVYHESTYDRFHKDGEQIYRYSRGASREREGKFESWEMTNSPGILGQELLSRHEAIYENLRIGNRKVIASLGSRKFGGVEMVFADPNFFTFFSYDFLEGKADEVLKHPNAVVLTKSFAQKLSSKPKTLLDKTLSFEGRDYVVKGIINDPPSRSHLLFEAVCRRDASDVSQEISWSIFYVTNYFKVKTPEDAQRIEDGLRLFFAKQYAKAWNQTEEEFLRQNKETNYWLKPLYAINQTHTLKMRTLIFSSIALLILLLAVANFISMGISQASLKAKEIGLRKASGASTGELVRLFFLEAVILTVTATLLSLLILEIAAPLLNAISERSINLYAFGLEFLFPFLFLLVLIASVLGAVLPAYYLASLNPVEVLHGGNSFGVKKPFFQKSLTVVQFAIAMMLFIAALVINEQLRFIQNRNLGYGKENILFLDLDFTQQNDRVEALKNELQSLAEVEGVTQSASPINAVDGGINFYMENDKNVEIIANTWGVEKNFAQFYGLQFVEKSEELLRRESGVVYVNETFMKEQHWESFRGKRIKNFMGTFEVAGVLKDFVTQSAHEKIKPMIVMPMKDKSKFFTEWCTIAIRLKKNVSAHEAVQKIETVWNKVYDGDPIRYNFLTDELLKQYDDEYRFRNLIGGFSLIAFVLSAMGLFALSAYTVEQRTKEMGVRKVHGAVFSDILRILFFSFSKKIFFAGLFAFPLSFWLLKKWLVQFSYAAEITPFVFFVAFLIVWLVAGLTVSYHSLQVARVNPVEALRDE